MTPGDQMLFGALMVGGLALVVLVILFGSASDTGDRQIEDVHYDRQRASARALRTPVVLPPGHPRRPVVSAEDFRAATCPDEIDDAA